MTNGKEENRKRVAKEKGTRENPWREKRREKTE
jgi:hypothetical protein